EVERELPELVAVVRQLFPHTVALAFERLAQVTLLALAPFAQPPLGLIGEDERARLELWQKLVDVTRCGLEQPPRDLFRRLARRALRERGIEQLKAPRFGITRIDRQGAVAAVGIGPARGDRHELLVQALGARAVQREPPE